jgi:hypothetical protein
MSSPTFGTSWLSQRTKVTAVIRETRPIKALRNVVLVLTLILIGATSMAHPSVAEAQTISPTTTGVMVILTVKAGVTREQVMAVMPAEIRQTVQLYLNAKIREWYSRSGWTRSRLLAGFQGCRRGAGDHGGPTVGQAKSSTYAFCHSDRGAVTTSLMPIA